ncbi:MAG: hypothetical protein PHN77_14740, partial [Thermoguttaceae bacterium]|nr:hypothetical protein [Thermoguttaceae bacterium]
DEDALSARQEAFPLNRLENLGNAHGGQRSAVSFQFSVFSFQLAVFSIQRKALSVLWNPPCNL